MSIERYLKSFSSHTEYEEYVREGNLLVPNISYCETEDEVHYSYDAEIEYLEFNGTQYINTYLIPTYDLSCAIKFNSTNTANNRTIFGVANDWHNTWYRLMYYNNIGRFISGGFTVINQLKTGEFTFSYNGSNNVIVNNTNYPITPSTFTTSLKLYIGANNSNITPSDFFYGKIYYFKLGSILDMIPVRVGDVGYMYDKVSGKLFGNSGSGNFILGPDKE